MLSNLVLYGAIAALSQSWEITTVNPFGSVSDASKATVLEWTFSPQPDQVVESSLSAKVPGVHLVHFTAHNKAPYPVTVNVADIYAVAAYLGYAHVGAEAASMLAMERHNSGVKKKLGEILVWSPTAVSTLSLSNVLRGATLSDARVHAGAAIAQGIFLYIKGKREQGLKQAQSSVAKIVPELDTAGGLVVRQLLMGQYWMGYIAVSGEIHSKAITVRLTSDGKLDISGVMT